MAFDRPLTLPAVDAAARALPPDAEWLLADGAGGYACGCADDLPRRRYHGLWLARPSGEARRYAVVSGLDERVLVQGATTHLLHAHWRDLEQPSRPEAAVGFVHRPLPTWQFRGPGFVLERSVALQRAGRGGPCCLVRWTHRGGAPLRLAVRPLLGWCEADHLPPANELVDGAVHASGASWGVRPTPLLPMLWLTADGVAAFRGEPAWYRGFVYATDRARGYDQPGDRWSPGVLELDLAPGQHATIVFAFGEPCTAPAARWQQVETEARERAAAASGGWRQRLALGADDFLYRADGGRLGVLAGFPWFTEWGRDVFVALPGLTLARGRADLCAEALRGALPFLRDGLLPNVYGADPESSHYDSCDAALWWSLAVQRFADAGGDAGLLRGELLPALAGIARAYERGTGLGLAADGDGLLRAGRDDLNATWMDAQVDGVPVTPRAGLPVEIQALWYTLLAFLAEHDPAWRDLRDRCGRAFVASFWLAAGAYLADRVHGGVADAAVRPNMVIAAALPRSPLSPAQRAAVVSKARAELVTPVGLRTLSPLVSDYHGRYQGDPGTRDRSYHQGTVWPWLGGFFVEAALAAAGRAERAAVATGLRAWLDGFAPELDRAGIDHVSEVFDGDPPHHPGGTFAQAWNTGELLRAARLLDEAAP